jgi:hypothetical protein
MVFQVFRITSQYCSCIYRGNLKSYGYQDNFQFNILRARVYGISHNKIGKKEFW